MAKSSRKTTNGNSALKKGDKVTLRLGRRKVTATITALTRGTKYFHFPEAPK